MTTAGRENVLDQLSEQLDALSAHVADELRAGRAGERNRLSLLYLHATFALFTAPLFLVWAQSPAGMGGVTWELVRGVPGIRVVLPVLLFVGGAILTLGTATRSMRWAGIGLTLVWAWYAILAASFTGAVFRWLAVGAPGGAWPAVYAPLVYAHLAAIMAIHMRTLWAIIRHLRAR